MKEKTTAHRHKKMSRKNREKEKYENIMLAGVELSSWNIKVMRRKFLLLGQLPGMSLDVGVRRRWCRNNEFANQNDDSTPRRTRIEHGRGHPRQSWERRALSPQRRNSAPRGGPHREKTRKPKIDLKTLLELGQNISIISYIGFNMVTHTRYVVQQDCKG